jgi:hypothetical protein
MAQYRYRAGTTDDATGILRTQDGAAIPHAPANADWWAYQAWLDQGNTPDPADPPPPRPAPLDYGADDPPRDQLQDAITTLRAYLAVSAPTAAQSAAALKIVIRVVLYALRRLGE